MALSLVGVGSAVFGTTSAVTTGPAGYSATNDDLAVVFVVAKRVSQSTTTGCAGPLTATAGWAVYDAVEGGTGSAAADAGPLRVAAMYKKVTGGAITWPTVTLGAGSHCLGVVSAVYRAGTGYYTLAAAGISDTTSATSFGGTADADIGFTNGDEVAVISGVTSDAAGTAIGAASISATSATFSSLTEGVDTGTTNGDDFRIGVHTGNVTAGTSSAAAVTSFTLASTASTGAQMVLRIRETTAPAAGTAPTFIASSTAAALATSTSVSAPTGTQAGDHQLIVATSATASETFTAAPAGWIKIAELATASADSYNTTIFISDPYSNPGTGSATITKTSNRRLYLVRASWRGGAGWLGVNGVADASASTSHTLPTLRAEAAGQLYVGVTHYNADSSGVQITSTPGGSAVERADVFDDDGGGTTENVWIGDLTASGAGDQSISTTSSASDDGNKFALMLAGIPAAAASAAVLGRRAPLGALLQM